MYTRYFCVQIFSQNEVSLTISQSLKLTYVAISKIIKYIKKFAGYYFHGQIIIVIGKINNNNNNKINRKNVSVQIIAT